MIPSRFKLYFQNYKKTILLMSMAQLIGVSLYAAAMKILATVTSDVFLNHTTWQAAAPVLLVLLFLFFFREIIIYQQKKWQQKASLHCRQALRQKLHRYGLQHISDSSQLLTLTCESCETLDDDWQLLIPALIALLLEIPCLLFIFAWSDMLTAVICCLTLPISPFLLYLLSTITKKRSERAWQELAQLTSGFHELICALPLLKIFQQDKAQRQTASQLIHNFSTATLNTLEIAFLASFVLELITTLSIALIAVTIGLRLLNHELSFATGFFILLLLPEFYRPLRQSGTAFHTAMNTNTAAEKIEQTLAMAKPPVTSSRHESLPSPPAINVCQLTFTYPQHHTPVLKNISLQIPARQITVLTGSSGCGKTTLLMLMAGLYMPNHGEIYLEDQLLHTMHPASRQKLIGYLPQQPHLFQATLAENLLLWQTAPKERCLQALRLAQLEDFFHSLPQGLDTPCGDGKQKLSQGQLKRLGLARLILQNNPIMLLDEPTSGLDATTEKAIIHTLSVLAKGRTMLISSHHPAVLELADKVIDVTDLLSKEATICAKELSACCGLEKYFSC